MYKLEVVVDHQVGVGEDGVPLYKIYHESFNTPDEAVNAMATVVERGHFFAHAEGKTTYYPEHRIRRIVITPSVEEIAKQQQAQAQA